MSVVDKIDAARHSISGSNTSLAVCKATNREIMGPKKKHVDFLVMCTKNEQFDVANLATLLFERCRLQSWIIVSKALVTFHNLMSNGDERFLAHIGTKRGLFDFQDFQDKTAATGYDMCAFIKRYSNYLNRKAGAYAEVEYDFCRAKRGREGVLHTMETSKLLMTLGEIQRVFDSLLDVNDLIKVFACYNDGMIKLLENYYTMNRGECKESLEIYKKFLSRIETVQQFLDVAKNIGVNEDSIPDLVEAPKGLLEALENHYESLIKGQVTANTAAPVVAPIKVPLERAQFNFNDNESSTTHLNNNEPTTILKSAQSSAQEPDTWKTIFEPDDKIEKTGSSSDDLLQLDSLFQTQQPITQNVFPQQNATAFPQGMNGFGGGQSNTWGSPAPVQASQPTPSSDTNPFDTKHDLITGDNDILQPMNKPPQQHQQTRTSSSDLHSTLNKVVGSLDDFNLTTTSNQAISKGHQWNAPKPKVKTGGTDFQLVRQAGTTLPPTNQAPVIGTNVPPMSQIGMTQPQQPGLQQGYMQPSVMQPGMHGAPRAPLYGQQQPMIRPQGNVFPPQPVANTNPFASSMPRNQVMF